ncbi:MAG: hypothetical protein U0795_26805 [Pirellulales bacterium]
MFRPIPLVVTLALVVASFILPTSANAFPYSRNNPFASYNVHGTNYASQQWEKNHTRRNARSQFARRSTTARVRRSR